MAILAPDSNQAAAEANASRVSGSGARSASWPDRLRRSALILLVAGLVLTALVVFGGLQPLGAIAAFVCITGAALVPWQVQDPDASRKPNSGPIR